MASTPFYASRKKVQGVGLQRPPRPDLDCGAPCRLDLNLMVAEQLAIQTMQEAEAIAMVGAVVGVGSVREVEGQVAMGQLSAGQY